jgi:hypothetical protein
MKATIERMKLALLTATVAAAAAPVDRRVLRGAAVLGMAGSMFAGPAYAQGVGFIKGFQNVNSLMQAGIAVLIAIGLLGGLGMIMGGLFTAYKKYDNRGGDDSGWGKIALQIAAGGLAMALGWVGTNVVETLGGTGSDIGKSITK